MKRADRVVDRPRRLRRSRAAVLAFPAAAGPRVVRARRRRRSRDLLLPVVLDAGSGRAAGRTGTSSSDGAPVLSTAYYPERGLYSSSNAKIVDGADARDRSDRRRHGGRLVVGVRIARGSSASPLVARPRRAHGLAVAIHVEPYRGRTPATRGRGHRSAPREKRVHGLLRLRRRPRPRSGLGGGARAARRRSRSSRRRSSSAARRRRASTASTRTTSRRGTEHSSRGSARRRTRRASLCAPSVGPGYDARLATQRPVPFGRGCAARRTTACGRQPSARTPTS